MPHGATVAGATPAGFRIVVALALPLIAAMSVVGTYFGQEMIVFAGLLGLSVIGFLFVRPVIGVAFMTAGYMVAAYPTALEALGVLSVINLLGVCLLILLLAQILSERDLTIVFPPPVLMLLGIGFVFLLTTLWADVEFPGLQVSRATGRTGYKIIDRTDIMAEAAVTRLAFLVFIAAFVRQRRDVRLIFFCFLAPLFVAIPSALLNWGGGELRHGFRVAASITAGANANRLGMICCFQIIGWWYWFRANPTMLRRAWAFGVTVASMLVISGTGSRSAVIGAAVTMIALVVGDSRYRVSMRSALGGVTLFTVLLAAVAPPQAVERMFNFFPETRSETGASSIELRETTMDTGKAIIRDHPLTGVGLGNFREVARQIYADKYFRPPHNSFLWAAAEGGIFVILGYFGLFAIAWRDLGRGIAMGRDDPEMAALGMAMQRILAVFLAYSAMADLWLSPLLYVQVGFAFVFRRCMEGVGRARTVPRTPVALREAA